MADNLTNNRSTVTVGAGSVLVNQTNINVNTGFFEPASGGGVDAAGENLFVSSISFNVDGNLPVGEGMYFGSTILASGIYSTLNFADSTGAGIPLAVSSLSLNTVLGAPVLTQQFEGSLSVITPSTFIDTLRVSTLEARAVNGLVPPTDVAYTLPLPSIQLTNPPPPSTGFSTVTLPADIFVWPYEVLVTYAGNSFASSNFLSPFTVIDQTIPGSLIVYGAPGAIVNAIAVKQ